MPRIRLNLHLWQCVDFGAIVGSEQSRLTKGIVLGVPLIVVEAEDPISG